MENLISRVLQHKAAAALFLAGSLPMLGAATFTNTPAAVSNTYSGAITLQIGGLTNGETVVIQKFLDANANSVIDGPDLLVQQFNLTDGTNFMIGGVTNFNVPGDLNSTTGAITATLNFKNGDFIQNIVGQYAFKLSSPVGHFGPVTNLFSVTNFPHAQQFTGNVVNSGTNVPNAIVILFPPPRPGHGPGNPAAATLADNSGAYTIKVPPGTYTPAAFQGNFVTSFNSPPVLTLGGGATIDTNLTLLAATQSIAGTLVDANSPGIGLPGIFLPVQAGGVIGIAFTDTDGNFTARVNAGLWEVNPDGSSLTVHGYVGNQDGTNVNAGTTGNIIPVSKATAMFYGSVKDNLGNPLAGIDVFAQDGDNQYESDGHTDQNGNYFAGALAGAWQVQINSGDSGNPTNYIFSQGLDQNGGTNLAAGQALLQDFTARLATNHITGNVQFSGTNIVGVQVSAYANIGGLNYRAEANTDASGNYSLNVANGNWSVGVSCCCNDDTLDGILGSGNYQCPNNQNVNIANSNGTANFIVQAPTLDVLSYYLTKQQDFIQTNATAPVPDTNYGPFNAYLGIIQSALSRVTTANVTLPTTAGRGLPAGGTAIELQLRERFTDQTTFDTVYPTGNYTFNMFTVNNGNQFPVLNLPTPVYPSTPHISNFAAAQTINPASAFLLQWDAFVGGTTNETIWCFINDTNGTPVFSTPYGGTDFAGSLKGTATSVTIPAGTLQSARTYTGVLIFFKNTSANTTGYPGAFGGTFVSSQTAFALTTLSPPPTLGQPARVSPTQFGFNLGGVPGSSYTILATTNLTAPLSNWFTVLVTNLPTNSIFILDNQATNKQRFYRARLGP